MSLLKNKVNCFKQYTVHVVISSPHFLYFEHQSVPVKFHHFWKGLDR